MSVLLDDNFLKCYEFYFYRILRSTHVFKHSKKLIKINFLLASKNGSLEYLKKQTFSISSHLRKFIILFK